MTSGFRESLVYRKDFCASYGGYIMIYFYGDLKCCYSGFISENVYCDCIGFADIDDFKKYYMYFMDWPDDDSIFMDNSRVLFCIKKHRFIIECLNDSMLSTVYSFLVNEEG